MQRLRNRLSVQSAVLVGLLVVSVVLGACNSWPFTMGREDCGDNIAALSLPDYVTIVSETCSSGIVNPEYNAEFVLPAARLTEFGEWIGIAEWQSDPSLVRESFQARANAMPTFLYGEYGDGARMTTVLIDTSRGDDYTVVLENVFVD